MQHGPRKRDVALQGAAMVLALGVGVLIGARACSTETEPEVVTKVETVTVEKLVYTCPPEPEPEPPKKLNDPKLGKRKSDGKKTLPDETESDDALRRRRLLAWVRDQASDLKTCNNASTETFRLAVTLQIGSKGEIKRVTFDAPPKEMPASAQSCLRRRIKRWSPPADFVEPDEKLVFGLTI